MGINSLTHRDDGSRVAVPVSTDDWAEAAGRRGCRAAGAVDGVSRRRRCSM